MRARSIGSCLRLAIIGFAGISVAAGGVAAGGDAAPGDAPRPAWAAPPLDRAITVFDGRSGETVTLEAMLDRLATADAVFLGETHIDETTHRVELAVYRGLLERRRGEVVLAMEMFERDVQPALDAYLAGTISERAFTEQARAWGQYRSAYRPLIEHAREGGFPVVASNFPRPLIRRIAMGGLEVIDDLDEGERRLVPAEIFANSPEYWRRVDNTIRGHVGMMRRDSDDQRLTSTQTLWDNAMGESCALALDAHPGSAVLHINGAFHSAYWDGTVRQFSLRKPDARVLTIDVRPSRNPSVAEVDGRPVADFVVVAESRAMDRNEGVWGVALDRKLDYRLHLPDQADSDAEVPLLIWLGDDGLTSEDGMDLWKDRLGGEAAIAVLEPPYRARYPDQSEGGRWFWADSFASDIGSVVAATERVWGYLLRNHPIDPERVCVAGEGTGGTVAAAIALLGDRMEHATHVFEPKRYAKLKDFPLPLPEYSDGSDRAVSVAVTGSAADEAWWRDEIEAYNEIGLSSEFRVIDKPKIGRDGRQEASLRAALELPQAETSVVGSAERVAIPADTPRARHWSRLYALRRSAANGQPLVLVEVGDAAQDSPVIRLDDRVTAESVAQSLPRCPGPFGGTTVLLLPDDLDDEQIEAWAAIEENDPLNRASRFHRVRVARGFSGTGERVLPAVLATLESEGRKNVLIVPAVFCAGPDLMRELERATRNAADRMTIHWLPGLGGALGAAPAQQD